MKSGTPGVLLAVVGAAVSAAAARGEPGEIVWQDVIVHAYAYGAWDGADAAPDGTVYWMNRGLRSYTQEGQLRWVRETAGDKVTIGRDGAIYTTEYVNTRTAEDPFWVPHHARMTRDNEIVWTLPLPQGCAWLESGPEVGPDGNIYGTCSGGYNAPGPAWSVHRDGWHRWRVPGFKTPSINLNQFDDERGRFYVRAGQIPYPNAPFGGTGGLVAMDLDGNVEWRIASSRSDYVGIHQPTGGVVTMGYAFDADGGVLWQYPEGSTTSGPDGAIYVYRGYHTLSKYSPDGEHLWTTEQFNAGTWVWRPVFSPDGSAFYITSHAGIGYPDTATLSQVQARRTSDGSLIWRYEFPRLADDILEVHPPAISPDGTRLYVAGYKRIAGHGHLWAFDTGFGAPPACGTSDFNGDGDAGTDQDIEAFFACIGGDCCGACFAGGSDFNGDGDAATDQDIESFFRVLGGGAC
ncbi:MAG TPA: hypothetical protein VD997_13460 [Phycisphaerales bacterium]|nr:hypothetical protein [Phycisphaerales bacterium]